MDPLAASETPEGIVDQVAANARPDRALDVTTDVTAGDPGSGWAHYMFESPAGRILVLSMSGRRGSHVREAGCRGRDADD